MRSIRKGLSARFWGDRRREVLERDGYACRRCGYSADPTRLDVAHVIGLGSRGTRNDPGLDLNEARNLVTLCRVCHQAKDARLAWTWKSINIVPDASLAHKYGWRETGKDVVQDRLSGVRIYAPCSREEDA